MQCTGAEILDTHLEWLRRFRRFYCRIVGLPMGVMQLSAVGGAILMQKLGLKSDSGSDSS